MGKKLKVEASAPVDASPTATVVTTTEPIKMLGICHIGNGKWTLVEADVPAEMVHAWGDMPLGRALDELKLRQQRLYIGAKR